MVVFQVVSESVKPRFRLAEKISTDQSVMLLRHVVAVFVLGGVSKVDLIEDRYIRSNSAGIMFGRDTGHRVVKPGKYEEMTQEM